MPFLLAFMSFGFIAVINWPYESKLLTPVDGGTFTDSYMGPILLAISVFSTLIASFIFFVLRLVWTRAASANDTVFKWLAGVFFGVIALAFLFSSLSIIWLGPAGITMMEQMKEHSDL